MISHHTTSDPESGFCCVNHQSRRDVAMLKVFCSPARYVQGRQATALMPLEMSRLGLTGPVLIIASPSARKQLESVWNQTFRACEAAHEPHILDFGGECSRPEIERGILLARQSGACSIVGAGGGKVLDTARAVASALECPVVCCPTTASSDAPCSALSVVYTPEGVFESCQFHKRNPDLVLVDTGVIVNAPVRYLISGMGDALATWFEADAAHRAHKLNAVRGASTLAAQAIAALCYRTLLTEGASAVASARVGAITPAFERIVEANTLLSGLGFESGGLAAAHSVHNGFTALPETHACLHGEKVAFGTLVQLVLEGRERGLMDEVLGFCVEVGLPTTLAGLGVERFTLESARLVAERALAAGETIHNEPFDITVDQLVDALFATDALGRAFQGNE